MAAASTRMTTTANRAPSSAFQEGVSRASNPNSQTTSAADMGARVPSEVVTRRMLNNLLRQVSDVDRMSPEVQDLLMDLAEDFVESVTAGACDLARYRKSQILDVRDVALHLEENLGIVVPGFAADELSRQAAIHPTPAANMTTEASTTTSANASVAPAATSGTPAAQKDATNPNWTATPSAPNAVPSLTPSSTTSVATNASKSTSRAKKGGGGGAASSARAATSAAGSSPSATASSAASVDTAGKPTATTPVATPSGAPNTAPS